MYVIEVDNSAGKSKTSKLVKRESKSHITEDTADNLTTTTTKTNENKVITDNIISKQIFTIIFTNLV